MGPFPPYMLEQGRDVPKYFTPLHTIYERKTAEEGDGAGAGGAGGGDGGDHEGDEGRVGRVGRAGTRLRCCFRSVRRCGFGFGWIAPSLSTLWRACCRWTRING